MFSRVNEEDRYWLMMPALFRASPAVFWIQSSGQRPLAPVEAHRRWRSGVTIHVHHRVDQNQDGDERAAG